MNGMHAAMSWTYGPDPKTAFGFDFSEIAVATELGPAPAWYIPADSQQKADVPANSWGVTVHGSNADRRQFLRFVPELHRCGFSVLDITYRNDVGAPASPDRLMHLGLTEWRDLEAAVRTAKSMGAEHIVLFGGSMAGAIVLQYLARSANAGDISAIMLDSPMLSVPRMIWYIAVKHGVPFPDVMTKLAIGVTDLRLKDRIQQIDILRFPPKLHPPVLLLQGTGDDIMPFEAARDFVAAGRKSGWAINYAEFPSAGHGAVWNCDPNRAASVVNTFLKSIFRNATH